jgi:hypothetical protein
VLNHILPREELLRDLFRELAIVFGGKIISGAKERQLIDGNCVMPLSMQDKQGKRVLQAPQVVPEEVLPDDEVTGPEKVSVTFHGIVELFWASKEEALVFQFQIFFTEEMLDGPEAVKCGHDAIL